MIFKTVNDKIDILIKCITLIYREILVNNLDKNKEYSTDIVSEILKVISKDNENSIGVKSLILDNLIAFNYKLVNYIETYTEEDILDNITTILKDDKNLLDSTKNILNKEMHSSSLKRSVVSIRNQLKQEITSSNIIKRVNTFWNKIKNEPNSNVVSIAKELNFDLDILTTNTGDTIPGIVADIDIQDESMVKILKSTKSLKDGNGTIKFGFREFNTMTQNSVKRGDSIIINALQHEYKSGLVQSLFMQIAQYNKPQLLDETKKPLLVYISFEDDPEVFTGFMYKYLYCAEFKVLPDITKITAEMMKEYIVSKLTVNGFHIKMVRVNPSEWTYKDFFNYITYLESQGYEIISCIVDYLVKMDITGCIGKGGTEYRDLWDRCRQFCSVKKILFISPHQMSTEAKQLVRNGTNKLNLVKEVAGKGYTELSKQLDQVVDIEICIAKALLHGQWVLTMMIGKHRGADILQDNLKYQVLKFPIGMPIPPNVGDDDYIGVNTDKPEEDDLFNM